MHSFIRHKSRDAGPIRESDKIKALALMKLAYDSVWQVSLNPSSTLSDAYIYQAGSVLQPLPAVPATYLNPTCISTPSSFVKIPFATHAVDSGFSCLWATGLIGALLNMNHITCKLLSASKSLS